MGAVTAGWWATQDTARLTGHRVGRIVELNADGQAIVDFPDNPGEPVVARSTLDAPARAADDPAALLDAPVLLVFEEGDPSRPIITGLIRDRVQPEPQPQASVEAAPGPHDSRYLFDRFLGLMEDRASS